MAGPAAIGTSLLGRFLSRLRFPQLFVVAAILFVLDLLIPDLIPFADEILLAISTVLLGSLQKDTGEIRDKPPMKDVTPDQR